MISRLKIALISVTFSLASACIYSKEPSVKLAETPMDDRSFEKALEKAAQTRSVFNDFETRYGVTAIYLSPEFRSAFAKRLESVYKRGDVELGEIGQKAGFFVSLQIHDDTRSDLTNSQHWTVALNTKEGPIRPILIKPLTDKERWRAFFPSVNQWTYDYLIVFDIPSVDPNAPKLMEKTTMSLTFANADAQVEMSW